MNKVSVPRRFGIECGFALDDDTTPTKEAGRLKRDAMAQRRANAQGGFNSMTEDDVIAMEDAADAMIARTVTWLELPGGEVPGVSEQATKPHPVITHGALGAIGNYTAHGDSRISEDASLIRLELLSARHLDCAPMALDAANTIKAQDSTEKMLAHQMAAAHELAMRFSARAMQCEFPGRSIEAGRYSAAAARQMLAYQSAMLTLRQARKLSPAPVESSEPKKSALVLVLNRERAAG